MFIKKFQFHNIKNPSITYTVLNVDHKNENLDLSFFENDEYKTTSVYLPLANKFLKESTWIEGEGSDRMMLVLHNGSRVEVDTSFISDDQFNAEGKRYHDYAIAEVINDKRPTEKRGHWLAWRGVKPIGQNLIKEGYEGLQFKAYNNTWHQLEGFKGDYKLEYNIHNGSYYYRFNNYGSFGSFDFIYKEGVFYKCSKFHYKRLAGKTGITRCHHLDRIVTKPAQAQLIAFFKNHYKGA